MTVKNSFSNSCLNLKWVKHGVSVIVLSGKISFLLLNCLSSFLDVIDYSLMSVDITLEIHFYYLTELISMSKKSSEISTLQ